MMAEAVIVFRTFLALALAFQPALLLAADVVVATERFELRSEPRVNLHHFLLAWAAADREAWPPYAPAVAERESWRALLDDGEQRAWAAAIEVYTATVNRSAIFDEGLITLRDWAAGVASADSVPAADRPLLRALEAALPIYRRYWWRAHDTRNRAWIESVAGVLEKLENEIAPRVEAAYGGRWPDAPIPTDVVLYANALGAYSTRGRITMGSVDASYWMPQSLEMLFHEASHAAPLESPLTQNIDTAFRALGRQAPENLWHDMIFFSTGAITRIVLAEHGAAGLPALRRARRLSERRAVAGAIAAARAVLAAVPRIRFRRRGCAPERPHGNRRTTAVGPLRGPRQPATYFLLFFFDVVAAAFAGLAAFAAFFLAGAAAGVRLTSSNVRFGSAAMHSASGMPCSLRTMFVPCTSDTIL